MTKRDLIIIPTYNEVINVKIIYEKIRKINKISEILFIDDNSPDNTWKKIQFQEIGILRTQSEPRVAQTYVAS